MQLGITRQRHTTTAKLFIITKWDNTKKQRSTLLPLTNTVRRHISTPSMLTSTLTSRRRQLNELAG
jgi:hypothetical protein